MLKRYRENQIPKIDLAIFFSVSWQTQFLNHVKQFREYMLIRFDYKIEDILISYEDLVKDFCFSVLNVFIEGGKYYSTPHYDVVRNMSLWRVPVRLAHYNDVIMSAIPSQITSLTIVYSSVYSGADQRNIKASRPWPLCGEFTSDRWIPRTNGQ